MIRIKEHTINEELLSQEPIIIDLGACRGEFINEIDRLYNIRMAILVEPNPTNFATLIKKNNYTLYNKAIASTNNIMLDFYEDINSPYNGSNIFNYFNGKLHKIETISLPTIIRDNNIDYVDLLKIDVEGAEYDLLSNLDDITYSMIGQITVEFHDFIDVTLKIRTKEIIERLHKLQFKSISVPIVYMNNSDNYDVLFYKEKNL